MHDGKSPESICARFCAELEAGEKPKIDSYLKMVTSDQRRDLKEALHSIQAKYAMRAARMQFEESEEGELSAFPSLGPGSSDQTIESSTIDQGNFSPEGDNPIEQEVISQGQHIGRYKLLQLLGTGGMGSVWLAEQSEPVRRRVALKLLRVDLGSKNAIPRFEAERQAIAMMDHPNIAKIYDAGTTDGGSPYFVMELVQGIELNQFCDREKLTIRQRLELMLPILAAVQHAHQKAIIHRDLKHSNVLVAGNDPPIPKVIDFGLAKTLSHHRTLTEKTMFTEAGCVVGTLQYMSPEQADNKLDIDTRTDIYALGVMLYKLLTGTTPLNTPDTDVSLVDLLLQVRSADPVKPSACLKDMEDLKSVASLRSTAAEKLVATVSGDLDWIIMKALEKDRQRRYETANGLAMELQRYLNDETVLARPPSSIYVVKKFVKRNRGLVASAATIITLLIAGIIATSFATIWAMNASERATANSIETLEFAKRANQLRIEAQKSEAEIAKLQSVQEVKLHAYKTKQAWSDWQLNNIEAAWKKLDVARDTWEIRFLRTQFSSSKSTLHGHSGPVTSIDVSPNGEIYASCSVFDTAKIWDSKTDNLIHTFYLTDEASCIRFSQDSKYVACASLANLITMWDVKTGKQVKQFGPYDTDIRCFAFDPDGTNLVIGFSSIDTIRLAPKTRKTIDTASVPFLQIVKVDDGSIVESLAQHTKAITSVEYSSDGKMIVSASEDGSVRCWRKRKDGFVVDNVFQHADAVNCASLSPSGELLATATEDNMVCIWNTKTQKKLKSMTHDGPVTAVSFSSDGKQIASCSKDRTARSWSLDGEELLSLKGHFAELRDVSFSATDGDILTSSDDSTIKIWDARQPLSTLSTQPHAGTVWATDVSGNQRFAISVCQDGTIAATDIETGAQSFDRVKLDCEFLTVSASPTHPIFVTGDSDSKLRIWDLASGKQIEQVDAHQHNIWHVHFSPDGKRLVSACEGGVAKVWDTSDWTVCGTLEGHSTSVCSARFSNNGKLVVTGCDDGIVRLFSAKTFVKICEFTGHESDIWRAVFSPDDCLVASSGYDGIVIVWDIQNKKLVHKFRAHDVEIAGLTFSRDGSRLMTASDDGAIRIWDVETAIELFELRESDHSQCVHIALSKDGTKLVSGSGRGLVTVRTATASGKKNMPLRPHQCDELSVSGLARLLKPNLPTDMIREELATAKECCNHYPYFTTWTNRGIAHCRLGQFESAEQALREARRQEALQYGHDDLAPYVEGYLYVALQKQGKQQKANFFRDQFLAKIDPWKDEPWAKSLTERMGETDNSELPDKSALD